MMMMTMITYNKKQKIVLFFFLKKGKISGELSTRIFDVADSFLSEFYIELIFDFNFGSFFFVDRIDNIYMS